MDAAIVETRRPSVWRPDVAGLPLGDSPRHSGNGETSRHDAGHDAHRARHAPGDQPSGSAEEPPVRIDHGGDGMSSPAETGDPSPAAALLRRAAARETTARARDRRARARDRAAAARDAATVQRDAEVLRDGARTVTGAQVVLRAAHRRRRTAEDHALAAEHRAGAAADRAAAAKDRMQASHDRRRARADLVTLAKALATTEADPLTGARTRRAGLSRLEHEIDRCRRTGTSLVVAYVDTVGLKHLNDTEGHGAGDAMLMRVVTTMRRHMRSYDLIVRVGGDEFVCAMSTAELPDARKRFSAIASDLAASADAVRTGFAQLTGQETAAELIARADAELTAVMSDAASAGRRTPRTPGR